MKKNILLFGILLVLTGLAWFLYSNKQDSTLHKRMSEFAVKDTAAITKIFLADKQNNTVLLERTSASTWLVNQKYPVRMDVLKTLLETMHDVSIKSPLPKTVFETTVKLMAANSIKVEIYQGEEKPVKVYYVGHPNQEHTGTYMLMDGAKSPFITHIEGFRGFLSTRFFTSEYDWRSTEIFKYDLGEIASVRVENFNKPTESFEIQLRDHQYYLYSYPTMKPQAFDTAKVLLYTALYKKVHFEFFEHYQAQTFVDSIRNTPPLYRYTVHDVFGKSKSIITYLKPVKETSTDYEGNPITHDIDRLYGDLDGKEMVIIQYFTFDPLSKGLSDFTKSR